MAFVPLLSILTNLVFPNLSFWIVGGVNLGLLWVDESNIKKQGYNTKYLSWFWLLLPVWMFKRAKLVGGSNWYAITYLVMLVLSLILTFVLVFILTFLGYGGFQ